MSSGDPTLRDRLRLASLRSQLPGQASSVSVFLPEEVHQLVEQAAVCSLSVDPATRKQAFMTVADLVAVEAQNLDQLAVYGMQLVLARLGNFPGRNQLAVELAQGSSLAFQGQPNLLDLETICHLSLNTVQVGNSGDLALTDYQRRIYRTLRSGASVSFSGPTSAGKSFVLGLDLVRRVSDAPSTIVFLVPTRALLRQVADNVHGWLRASGLDVPVRTTPIPVVHNGVPRPTIFVLTQERLLSLIGSLDGRVAISDVFVDEAQGIGDGGRGVLLQYSLEELLKNAPDIRLHFAAPAIDNPGYFFDLFASNQQRAVIEGDISPVGQNLILVTQVPGRPRELSFHCPELGETASIGSLVSPENPPKTIGARMAFFASLIGAKTGPTIIYANGQSEAITIARALVSNGAAGDVHPIAAKAGDRLAEYIHPEYAPAELLGKGIGVHFGNMPTVARGAIETCFRSGHLKFLVATSTLLQGVNLPARNIIMRKPRRGKGNPLSKMDFLNLAGRAGRLTIDFTGNVWLIDPGVEEAARLLGETPVLAAAATQSLMGDGGAGVRALLSDSDAKIEGVHVEDIVPLVGRLYRDVVLRKQDIAGSFKGMKVQTSGATATEATLRALVATLPHEIYTRNPAVLPRSLEELYLELKGMESLGDMVPCVPDSENQDAFYRHLAAAIRVTERVIGRNPSATQYKYYAWLANKWVSSKTLRFIIERSIEHERAQATKAGRVPKSAGTIIDGVIQDIEQVVRFRLVKHLRAFYDVLRRVLQERGDADLAHHMPQTHLFLEIGTYDQHVVRLVGLGLTRSASIMLGKPTFFSLDDDDAEVVGRIIDAARLIDAKRDRGLTEEVLGLFGYPDQKV